MKIGIYNEIDIMRTMLQLLLDGRGHAKSMTPIRASKCRGVTPSRSNKGEVTE